MKRGQKRTSARLLKYQLAFYNPTGDENSFGTFVSGTRQLPCIFLLDGEKAEINRLVAMARTIFGHVQFRVRWQISIYRSNCKVPFIICT